MKSLEKTKHRQVDDQRDDYEEVGVPWAVIIPVLLSVIILFVSSACIR